MKVVTLKSEEYSFSYYARHCFVLVWLCEKCCRGSVIQDNLNCCVEFVCCLCCHKLSISLFQKELKNLIQ